MGHVFCNGRGSAQAPRAAFVFDLYWNNNRKNSLFGAAVVAGWVFDF
jgi:hypothetical protein